MYILLEAHKLQLEINSFICLCASEVLKILCKVFFSLLR